MSGNVISLEEFLQECADHEAGHYVMAHVEKILYTMVYITIERGTALKTGTLVGGGLGMKFDPEPTRDQWGVYAVAGMVGQMQGILRRNAQKGVSRVDAARSCSMRVESGGYGDILQFREKVGPESEFATEYLERAQAVLDENWHLVEAVSAELQANKTLYYEEGLLIIGIEKSEDLDTKGYLQAYLEVYREHRREITDGEDYDNFSSQHPGLPFFESLASLKAREPALFDFGYEDEGCGDDEIEGGSTVGHPSLEKERVSFHRILVKGVYEEAKRRFKAKVRSMLPWGFGGE